MPIISATPPRLQERRPARAAASPPPASEPVARDTVEISRPAELVPVSHTRELRGAWIASVWNINFPSSPQTSAEQQKTEMIAMLDRLKETGFNSVFFQVRPEGDALYKSSLEPWSNWLSGTQGKDPGYDPLETLVTEAHKRNLEVHAWLNPFRAASSQVPRVAPHIAVEHPEVVHPYGSSKWMDPGASLVREKLVDVCKDITHRYDVDGIHFDDYFYPYPEAGKDFPDDDTWHAYQAGGGTMSRADWRRENVNQSIRAVHAAVLEEKDHVRFGVSPFGMPAPERPPGTSGFDQYEGLYADTQKWMDEGIVDYLAPQLYWPTTQPKQPYGPLLNWWADHTKGGRTIFAGNNLADLGKNSKWTVDEYRQELAISRAKSGHGCDGNIWWNIGPLMEDRKGIVGTFKNEFYKTPALTPPLSTAQGKTVVAPDVQVEGGTVKLHHNDAEPLRAWTVYRREGQDWKLDHIVPGAESQIQLGQGKWAVAAATMQGVESQGVVVNVA